MFPGLYRGALEVSLDRVKLGSSLKKLKILAGVGPAIFVPLTQPEVGPGLAFLLELNRSD